MHGDRNTQYFHAWANQRRRNNKIIHIIDAYHNIWNKHDDIGGAFTAYFQSLFSTGNPVGVDACLSAMGTVVTSDMNHKLLSPFTDAEEDMALSHMYPLKAP